MSPLICTIHCEYCVYVYAVVLHLAQLALWKIFLQTLFRHYKWIFTTPTSANFANDKMFYVLWHKMRTVWLRARHDFRIMNVNPPILVNMFTHILSLYNLKHYITSSF